jgi:hypothetical protein
VLVIVASNPILFLFMFFLAYACSGIVRVLPFWQRRHPAETTEQPAPGKSSSAT